MKKLMVVYGLLIVSFLVYVVMYRMDEDAPRPGRMEDCGEALARITSWSRSSQGWNIGRIY